MDGVTATRSICQHTKTKVLVLTTFDDQEYVAEALQAGAMGYLLKDTPLEELAAAIRAVYKGCTQLGPGLFRKVNYEVPASSTTSTSAVSSELAALTPRERAVLRLIATGASNQGNCSGSTHYTFLKGPSKITSQIF